MSYLFNSSFWILDFDVEIVLLKRFDFFKESDYFYRLGWGQNVARIEVEFSEHE